MLWLTEFDKVFTRCAQTATLNLLLVMPSVVASIAVALRIVSPQQRNAVICDGDGAVSCWFGGGVFGWNYVVFW